MSTVHCLLVPLLNFIKRSTVASSGENILKGLFFLPLFTIHMHTHTDTPTGAHYTCTHWKICTQADLKSKPHRFDQHSLDKLELGKQSNLITTSLRSLHCHPIGLPVVSTRHWSWGGQRLEREGEQQQRVRVIKWGKLRCWQPAPNSQWCAGSLYRRQGTVSIGALDLGVM